MTEYIDREALKKKAYPFPCAIGVEYAVPIRAIDEAPAADVQEVRHGEWKECYEDWRKQIAGDECSVCGFQHFGASISHYHYCPNCGAKMDESEDEE